MSFYLNNHILAIINLGLGTGMDEFYNYFTFLMIGHKLWTGLTLYIWIYKKR